MDSQWPKKYFWQYKTSPTHPFDRSIRFLLRPIMKWRGTGKISHWWHWRAQPNKSYTGILLKGDANAFDRKGIQTKVRMSLGGWKTVYVLKPKDKAIKQWFYAYPVDKHTINRCALILEGPIRVLQGPRLYYPIGLDKDNNEITLKVSGPFNRFDSTHPWPIV